jgi:hypothetical protein
MKSIALLSLFVSLAGVAAADSATDNRAPEVPTTIQVSSDFKVSFRTYAYGVQIYTGIVSPTDPTKLVWTLKGPEAVLLDSEGNIVGAHYAYAGPTRPAWQFDNGGFVVGSRTIPPVLVDPTAIAWLLLDAVYAEGPGVLKRTVYIQRVNTVGGLAPVAPPPAIGAEIRIPYTAEYYFYRAAE